MIRAASAAVSLRKRGSRKMGHWGWDSSCMGSLAMAGGVGKVVSSPVCLSM